LAIIQESFTQGEINQLMPYFKKHYLLLERNVQELSVIDYISLNFKSKKEAFKDLTITFELINMLVEHYNEYKLDFSHKKLTSLDGINDILMIPDNDNTILNLSYNYILGSDIDVAFPKELNL